jgi:P27 family predicted phage terminase small subunit
MATTGPKNKPKALKILEGTYRADRDNPQAPEPPVTRGAVPPDFLDELAIAEWERIVPELETLGIMSNIDIALVTSYCVSVSELAEACKRIEIDGYMYETENREGCTVQRKSPWIEVRNKAIANIVKTACEMGMTPASRSKVIASKQPKKESKWAGL